MNIHLKSRQGSALIISLVMSAALVIIIGSYFALVNDNMRHSQRSYLSSATMNLAESGLEEGMWAINQVQAGTAAATAYATSRGWTIDDAAHTATAVFNNVFGQNTYVKVKVTNYKLDQPERATMTAQAIYSQPNLAPSEKWVHVVLQNQVSLSPSNATRYPPFQGLVAKHKIELSGNNASVDSWNSELDKNGDGAKDQYGASVQNDKAFVGSTDAPVDLVNVGNGDILGYVATNQDANITNNVNANGSILGFDSSSKGYTQIDPTRVSTDFNVDLPDAINPTPVRYSPSDPTTPISAVITTTISGTTSLPRSSDLLYPASDGVYYYKTSSISLAGGGSSAESLSISPGYKVVLIIDTINVTGQAEITIPATSGLAIYATGNVVIGGQGVTNAGTTAATVGQPKNFQVWGTAAGDGNTTTNEQTIDIAGNGVFSGTVYAPNATVKVAGNGGAMGAIVGNDIKVAGNGEFHYDESLGSVIPPNTKPNAPGASELKLLRWRELTGSQRTF